jgi:hypothetical protein
MGMMDKIKIDERQSSTTIGFEPNQQPPNRQKSSQMPSSQVSLQPSRSGLSAPRGVSTDYVLVVEVRYWKDEEGTNICYEKSPGG